MMAHASARHADRMIDYLRQHKPQDGDISLKHVVLLAETMTDSYKEFFEKLDTAIYRDLSEVAAAISQMKSEIGLLRAEDIKHNRIPQAGRELDAIVGATEEATHTIMESAEAIMSADASDIAAYQALVNDRIVEIFEACAFQDITGQRISKVVATLNYIEERVSSFAENLGLVDSEDGAPAETAEEKRQRELILHGPQHAGEGVNQADIDALLADDPFAAVSQSDIDKLFD